MPEVRKIVAEMVLKGVVKVVKSKPTCVSPLGLVTKIQEDGSKKFRLVWDASRHINKFVALEKVKLMHLEKALELTEKDDFQATFDLASAYYHIRIDPSQHQYLGACITNSDGSKLFFQYEHLPFGLSSAVHAITKIWKPIGSHLNSLGIKNSTYIDDIRVVAKKESIEAAREKVAEVVTNCGWAIEPSKSDGPGEGSTTKKYLGFIINSQDMIVSATSEKLEKVSNIIQKNLVKKATNIKELAKIAGLITSLEPSHEMLARITTRSSYCAIQEHTDTFGWSGLVPLNDIVKKELKFFQDHMFEYNGASIKNSLTEARLDTVIPAPISNTKTLHNVQNEAQIFVSDASETKAFVYELTGNSRKVLEYIFDDVQRESSSTARELLAILMTLKQAERTNNFNKKYLYWCTDSENAARAIAKGSRTPAVQEIAFQIALLCKRMNLKIEPIHLKREDPRIQLADEGSKSLDTDNWSIDQSSFQELNDICKFDYDMFADFFNRKCEKFCSLYYHEETRGVDAFSISWEGKGNLWICPPVKELIKCYMRITSCKCRGVLVMPIWYTSSYLSFFLDGEGAAKAPFSVLKKWWPYIIQNEGATNSALFGRTPFQFVALMFDTTRFFTSK